MKSAHHHLLRVQLEELRPTQMTIGFAEVEKKRLEWQSLSAKKRKALINSHWFPSVIGPKGEYYIVDHHHLGMALHQVKEKEVSLIVLKDLSWLDLDSFWKYLEFNQWVHPYDESGNRVEFKKIPKSVHLLVDDPYRSLAGIVRDKGGFAKEQTPFAEFLWADFYRRRIAANKLKRAFDLAVDQAILLSHDQEASYLPGWINQDK